MLNVICRPRRTCVRFYSYIQSSKLNIQKRDREKKIVRPLSLTVATSSSDRFSMWIKLCLLVKTIKVDELRSINYIF